MPVALARLVGAAEPAAAAENAPLRMAQENWLVMLATLGKSVTT
jgi:hypothetical protein